jgi:hypothetical protein
LDLATGTLGMERIIDTVEFLYRDYGLHVLRHSDSYVDVLRRNGNETGLRIDRMDTTGVSSTVTFHVDLPIRLHGIGGNWNGLANEIDGPGNVLDYDAAVISGGRKLLVWSEATKGDSADVYASVFDESWTQLGSPYRINTVGGCENMGPTLVLRNDTAFIAYYSNRSGIFHVYLRTVTLDNLTATTPAIHSPESFVLSPLFPNPASAYAGNVLVTISSLLAGEVRLSLFDVLGRCQFVEGVEVYPGVNRHRLAIANCQPGLYYIVAESRREIRTRVLILR